MNDNEQKLLDEITELYNLGSKTFCLTREQIEMVMGLLRNRKRIAQGAEIAQRYIKKYLDGNI